MELQKAGKSMGNPTQALGDPIEMLENLGKWRLRAGRINYPTW